MQTPQIYLGCADIVILSSGSSPTSTAPAQPSSTACAAPVATVSVNFDTKVRTTYGETVKVVGSISQFGGWEVAKAPSLDAAKYTDANPVWTGSFKVPAGTSFEYKLVKVASSGSVTWESGSNRVFTVPRGCQSEVGVGGEWR